MAVQNLSELIGRGCRCMIEDNKGSLWFGVNGGVVCYDGLNWKDYPFTRDSSDISVVSLCLSSDGLIYAGTTKGISVLKNGIWRKVKLDLDFGDPVEHPYNKIPIIETADKSIWIGSHQGIVRLKDEKIVLYREDAVYSIPEESEKLKNLAPFHVYNIFQEKNGKMWFGLSDGRIFKCEVDYENLNSNLKWNRIDTEAGYVRSRFPLIKVTSSGNVYVVSCQNDGGINIKEGKRWSLFKSKKDFGINDLYSDVIELKDGSVCVGGIGSIFIRKSGVWNMYESSNMPFASNRLILYETRDQKLYITGLANDVWRIDLSNQRWATLEGLSFQDEDSEGGKWFIASNGSVVYADAGMRHWKKYTTADGIIDSPVAIYVSENDIVWIAGSHNKLAATCCLHNNKWKKQIHTKLGWGIDRRAIHESKDGSIWFGSASDVFFDKGQKGGIVKYHNADNPEYIKFEYHYSDDVFKITGIYGIGETTGGKIWSGQLGFYCFDQSTNKFSQITEPSGLNTSFVDCISTSSSGDLWVGTRTMGVFFFNSQSETWSHYTVSNGLSSNTIIHILAESNDKVWVATNKDISFFDGRSWTKNAFHGFLKPKMDGISIKSTRDGALWVNVNEPTWYRKAFYKDSNLLESNEGFSTTRYYPDISAPKTIITFSQEKIAQPGNVILSWSANDPWKMTPIDKIQYSYRIDNNPWSEFTYKTSDIFLSLAAGDHTFEVKARDKDFNVDPTPEKISFYVVNPVWAQPWFIILILTFLSTIAFFIFHLYNRNIIIQEMSETKVRLFANISHELRTPLTLIMGPLLKVVESPALNEEFRKPLQLVNRNCHRLLRLINQVLDFRKLEAGQLKFEPKQGDIVDFLSEEVSVFSESAESKNINLKFETDFNKLDIWFDPDKIEKIMFNLLSNALKFTPQNGSVTIHISKIRAGKVRTIDLGLRRSIRFSKWLEIIVRDSGVGISSRNIEKVFDRFYQVKDHIKTAVGGTGIGLSVVKELVNIHGGKISVESKEGIGTTFLVKLPFIEEIYFDENVDTGVIEKSEFIKLKYPEKENERITPDIEEEVNNNGKSKILIVEDQAEMREYLREELKEDYEILEAVDGEDGLGKAADFGPEIILSDIMMPQMDGIEFCKRIKTEEKTSHIAVILLTARSSQECKMEGLETGADDYIVKPFYSKELQVKIHNILETRKKLREKLGQSLKLEPTTLEITSVDQKFIKRAIAVIEEHIDDSDFNVETFSKLVGMSRVSLYNKLKSLTDHSVQEFIFTIRLKRAAQLLRESGMSVTEIAYSVGFKDPSHFSKLFKKQFGVSPKAYVTSNPE